MRVSEHNCAQPATFRSRFSRWLLAAILLTADLGGQSTIHQQPMGGQRPTIRTTVPLVTVPVSVANLHGGAINGLDSSNFVLLDDGKPRQVRVDTVDSGLPPIALVTVIQTSDISLSALAKIRKVGAMIPEAVVGANGEAAVLTFDEDIKVAQEFTTDADAISKAFRRLTPADNMGGRMIDAVQEALNLLANRPGSRRANIVIISESRDRGSKEKLTDLILKIQRTGVTIYSLTYSAYLTPFTIKPEEYQPTGGGPLQAITEVARLGKQNTVAALTDVTGGRRFRFETKSKLENDLIRLGTEIHSRYLISFRPDLEQRPRFHHLEVHVKSHPDALIRARPGYWAASADAAK
ncbi:MAG: VWA domain-containing protein [Bryobacteraceae bacterium]